MMLKRFIIVFLVLLFLMTVFVVGFKIVEFPRYIALDPPSNSILPDLYWYNTQLSILSWDDAYTKTFLWRREARVHTDLDETWNDVFGYIDAWLATSGWNKFPSTGQSFTCEHWLPEAEFLEPGENGYVVYHQEGYDIDKLDPLLCLAIWPVSYFGEVQGYDVVIVIGNPSPYSRFLHELD